MAARTQELIRVRYGETDQMGHAYYANYLLWFEQARGAWCRARGFTYKSLEERGYRLPVVEVGVKYRSEVHYDDLLTVQIWLEEVRRASILFKYELRIEGSTMPATEGFTWHVLMGLERKAITIPEDIRQLLTRNPGDEPGGPRGSHTASV